MMTAAMWAQYKKTLLISQLFIVGVCAALWYYKRMHPAALGVVFLTMQLASLLGAWWGAWLKRRIERDDKTLPLQRRRY